MSAFGRFENLGAYGGYEVDERYNLVVQALGHTLVDTLDLTTANDPQMMGAYFEYMTSLLERPSPLPSSESNESLTVELDDKDVHRSRLDLLALVRNGLGCAAICDLMQLSPEEYQERYSDLVQTLHTKRSVMQTGRVGRINRGTNETAKDISEQQRVAPDAGISLAERARRQKVPELEHRLPVLRAEQEVELAKQIEAGVLAQERLAEALKNDKFNSVERQELKDLVALGHEAFFIFRNSNIGLVDLFLNRSYSKIMQSGITDYQRLRNDVIDIGVERAIMKFDYALGFKFSTYAMHWIRHALITAIAAQQPVYISKTSYESAMRIQGFEYEFSQKHGREPTIKEILAVLGNNRNISAFSITRTRTDAARLNQARSLDGPVDGLRTGSRGIEKRVLRDVVVDRTSTPFDEQITDTLALGDALKVLQPEVRSCVEMLYGLGGQPKLTYAEIAEELGMTKATVQRRVYKALKTMREMMEE